MISFAQYLTQILSATFESENLPPELGAVRVSDRPDLAPFQCNGAMAAAKHAKKAPRAVAEDIVARLQDNPAFSKLEIAGPGFINLHITDQAILDYFADQNDALNIAQKNQTVIIDHGGMNVAKAMHVGHLRSLVIGACIKNIMTKDGYHAMNDIHLGDWGLQMGQIISEFEIQNPSWPYFSDNYSAPETPEDPPFAYSDLEEIYPQASAACKENPERLEIARTATAKLQAGHAGYRALWQHFIDLSIKDIKQNIALIGIDFDIWKGEACVDPLIPEITEDLKSRKIIEHSDGAWIIPVAQENDSHDIPPLMFLKSDGAATYGTTDIATIYERAKLYPDLAMMIYETDLRQNLHFQQVFRAAQKAGYNKDAEMIHIGHGTVNGTDGKPYKTREGKAMRFEDLISAVIEKASQRLSNANLPEDIDDQERKDIAQKIAIAALKYTELSNQPHMDYIFDMDRMTAFEGKTGPYLLYQAVRIQSLLAKASAQNASPSDEIIINDETRPLYFLLAEYPDQFTQARETLSPHILCDYVYRLAQSFSQFYAHTSILSQDNKNIRASYLGLCQRLLTRIQEILDILGMTIPKRM